ncbi:ELKS [Giardia lamblia P15]|uniref:ELKS n=1 Tax=Giardia intestinalis (strain P15) TaxID=658858 RepID=E1EWX8_GIAIA|nr:ELKS [Giardia lamblia P15]
MADLSSQWFDAVYNRDYELVRDLTGRCACTKNVHGQTALMVAAIADDERIVNLLLPHEAGQLDSQNRTALMLATLASSPGSAQLLAQKEKGILLPDGRNAMMMAAGYGAHAVVLALLPFFSYETDNEGNTALDHAAIGGHLEVVKILVQHLDFSIKDISRARKHATKNSFTHVEDFLTLALDERYGAKNTVTTMAPYTPGRSHSLNRGFSAEYRNTQNYSHQASGSYRSPLTNSSKMNTPCFNATDASSIYSLQELIQEREDQILRQNKLIDQLTSKISQKDAEIAHWQDIMSRVNASAAQCEVEEEATTCNPDEDVDVLKATIEVKDTNIQRLQGKLDEEAFQHRLIRAEHVELQDKYERLIMRIRKLQDELFQRDSSGINIGNVLYLQEKIDQLESELADARFILTNIVDENKFLAEDTHLQGDETVEDILRLEVKLLKHKYIQQHLKHGAAIKKIQDMCEKLHGKFNEKEREVQKERAALRNEKMSNDHTMLLNAIDEKDAKIRRLEASLATARQCSSSMADTLSGDENLSNLLSEIDHLKKTITAKDEQMLSLLKQLEDRNNLQIVTEVCDIDKNQQDQALIMQLKEDLNNARATIAQLRADAHKNKMHNSSTQLTETTRHIAYTPKQSSSSQHSPVRLTQQDSKGTSPQRSAKTHQELTALLLEKDQKIAELQKELEGCMAELTSERESTYVQATAIARKLSDATDSPEDTVQVSHSDLISFKNLIYTQQQQLSTKEAEILTLKNTNRRLLDELSHERAEALSRIKTKVSALESENRDLQYDVSVARNTASSCVRELQRNTKQPSSINPDYALSPSLPSHLTSPTQMMSHSKECSAPIETVKSMNPYVPISMQTGLKASEVPIYSDDAPSYGTPGSDDILGMSRWSSDSLPVHSTKPANALGVITTTAEINGSSSRKM